MSMALHAELNLGMGCLQKSITLAKLVKIILKYVTVYVEIGHLLGKMFFEFVGLLHLHGKFKVDWPFSFGDGFFVRHC